MALLNLQINATKSGNRNTDTEMEMEMDDSRLTALSIAGPKPGRKSAKREDTVWGAWFFFSSYFKPSVVKAKNGSLELNQEAFMVQHDMENMYMWAFKERPENALGKMQLRSYMNGHSRQGERPFPFPVDKGFLRSHRMQRKHYRGLSNPQCIHGIEPLPSPNLSAQDCRRWAHLTGRDCHFPLPPEASEFAAWRSTPDPPSLVSPPWRWAEEFSGAMKNVFGPVTAAKSIYEDEESYLIVVTLPCVDLQRVRVSWRNTPTHGVVKVSGVSTSRMPFLRRHDKLFRLVDPSSEHCPPGEFVREIRLSTKILEGANIEAYYDGPRALLEIIVPKQSEPEEHEIHVCFLQPKTTGD